MLGYFCKPLFGLGSVYNEILLQNVGVKRSSVNRDDSWKKNCVKILFETDI